jgi:hypothetical protein
MAALMRSKSSAPGFVSVPSKSNRTILIRFGACVSIYREISSGKIIINQENKNSVMMETLLNVETQKAPLILPC